MDLRNAALEKLPAACFFDAKLQSIAFPATVRSVAEGCFEGLTVEQLDVGACRFTNLSKRAFARATIGGGIDLRSSTVVELPTGCFAGLQVDRLVLPSSAMTVGESCFEELATSTLVLLSEVDIVGPRAFAGSRLDVLDMAQTRVECLGPFCFAGAQVRTLSLPGGIKELGGSAFADVRVANDLAFPTLRKVGERCFAGAQGCNLDLSDASLTALPAAMFFAATLRGALLLPETVTELADSCFDSARFGTFKLQSNELQRLGGSAFARSELSTLDLSSCRRVRDLTPNCFAGASIDVLHLPDELVSIGRCCFMDANVRALAPLPSSLAQVHECAFFRFSTSMLDLSASTVGTIPRSCFFGARIGTLVMPRAAVQLREGCFTNAVIDQRVGPLGTT